MINITKNIFEVDITARISDSKEKITLRKYFLSILDIYSAQNEIGIAIPSPNPETFPLKIPDLKCVKLKLYEESIFNPKKTLIKEITRLAA